MRKGFIGSVIAGIAIVLVVLGLLISIERIPNGYVGVVYSMNGGVQDEVLTQGWHLVAPTKKVKEFTIANEQLVLSKDKRDGSEENEAFKVSTSDDANIAISFQMSYRFIQKDVVQTYKNFRGLDGSDIVNSRVKTVLKSKVSEITTNYSMMNIYSGNRSEINDKLTEYLNTEFSKKYGIEVIDASIIDVHPDKDLKKAIDDRVKALQRKQQAKAEQETARVEAETKIIKAKAEAKANKIISESLSTKNLDQLWIEKWDGKLPQVSSGKNMMYNLNN